MASEKDIQKARIRASWVRRVRRERAKRALRRSRQRPSEKTFKRYRSKIIDLLLKNRKSPTKLPKGSETFVAPREFSISSNVGEVLAFIRNIAAYARTSKKPKIVLDQRWITRIGLGADSVLGVVLKEIRKELRFTPGAFIRGYKPKLQHVQAMMEDIGSVHALFTDTQEDLKISLRSSSRVFRHQHTPYKVQKTSATADSNLLTIAGIADHLDECLSFTDRKLSDEARDSLCQYAGEVLDNAKEHSGLNEWVVASYGEVSPGGAVSYKCVIFSFGKTIAETFAELPIGSYPRLMVEPYIVRHRAMSFFSSGFREEDLLTVIALQGDMSSKNTSPSSDRGQGTVELIEFFQNISNVCNLKKLKAEMNIVSGSTRIRFDGTYAMQYREELSKDVIAFNAQNDLFERPDAKAVIALDEHFPGVLISIDVPLTSELLVGTENDS